MRKILTGCLLTALLVSCSDEDDSVSFKNTSKEKEVESIYELGKCTDDRKGEVIFVENKDEDYICFSGKWIPSSEFDNPGEDDESSSSVKESSSSAKDVSSSDKASSGETSSSDKASSSSEKASSSSGNVSSSGGSSSGETPKSSSSSTSGSSSSKTPESSSSVKSSSSKTHDSKTFVDTRDGKTYRMVTIGSQTWFAENLDYRGGGVTGYCHSGKPENCDKYAMLYDWDNAKKACPPGTHLPTIEELRKLMDFVGEDSSAVVLMADTGWTRDDGFLGTDEYGFAMLPGSYKAGKNSYGSTLGWSAQIWTASDSAGLVFAAYFGWNLPYISIGAYDLADGWGMSVRCIEGEAKLSSSSSAKSSSSSIKSSSSSQVSSSSSTGVKSSWQFLNPSISYGEMTDGRDGQVYKTIVIDNLTWMAENLNFETANSYCFNDTAKYCATYGRLYTWAAAQDACPEGWHLPSHEEFKALVGPDLNGQEKNGNMLKSLVGWGSEGLDTYGFSASPAGSRATTPKYRGLGRGACFWSSTSEEQMVEFYAMYLQLGETLKDSQLMADDKRLAYSVRCVKGAPGSY